MSGPESRVWVLEFPVPAAWLNSNDRLHWRKRAQIVAEWRKATWAYARTEGLPRGLPRVRIDVLCMFRWQRTRDRGNWHPTVKACIDGLGPERRTKDQLGVVGIGHGLIPDDSDEHLDGPHVTTVVMPKINGRCERVDRIRITITELEGQP